VLGTTIPRSPQLHAAAMSVATGPACLGKYAVPQTGPVLVYLAEDAPPVVRERVAGMAR
jgi:hypothetical protein